jgi:hypothetical protein
MNLCTALMLFRRSALPCDLSTMAAFNLAEDRALVALVTRGDDTACVFSSRVSCTWTYRHHQADNQIDALARADLPSLPASVVYQGLHLPYLETNGGKGNSYISPSLAEKCRTVEKVVYTNRWLPRVLRPMTYQGKFNSLVVLILQELLGDGVIHHSATPKLTRLGGPLSQREFNRCMSEIVPGRFSERDLKGPQHKLNIIYSQELDRLSRSF